MADFNDDNLYRNPEEGSEPSQQPQSSGQDSAPSPNQNGSEQNPWQYPPQNPYSQPEQNGYSQNGYGQNGYNQNGYNQNGYNQNNYGQNNYNQGYYQNPNQNPYYTVPPQGQPPKKESNPMAVTSMVLGIFSIISCCASPLAVLLGIGGIVLAILSKKGQPMSGFAIAGIILSALGLLISLAFFAYYLFVLSMMKDPRYAAFFNEILEQYEMLQ